MGQRKKRRKRRRRRREALVASLCDVARPTPLLR